MKIEIKNLWKSYEGLTVFENFNAEFEANQTHAIVGKSGKGKTTFIRLLMGLETADQGEIIGIQEKQISAVFQEDRLCENLSVATNILLPHMGKPSLTKTLKEEILKNIHGVGLKGWENKLVNELSGGMKRRVSVLRAIHAPYDILFLDEPFKGLDYQTKAKTIDLVKNRTKNHMVFFITHDEKELQSITPFKTLYL